MKVCPRRRRKRRNVSYSVLTGLGVPHYSPLPTSELHRTNMGKELTVRGLIVGIIITLVFTAANVYFGLKAGLTFSTSIPAALDRYPRGLTGHVAVPNRSILR